MNEKPTYHDLEQRIKELEKTTIESEEKFATFFLKSPIPMAITVMKDGRYVEVNEAFAKVMGLKREELIDNTSVGAGYITAEDRAIFLDEYRRKGFVENLELQMHVKGGEPRYGLFNSSKITIGDKDFFLTQVTDVTERKWVEEALHKSEERFRTIFENAVEGIFVTTPEGRFLRANTAAARMLGYESPEELIAAITDTGSQLYTNPEDRDTMFTLLQKHGFVRNYEVRCRHRNGSIIWGMLNMRLARDDEGNILHIEGTCQDITARKRAEEAVKQSENRLSGIIEFLPDATFAINLEGKIITWNRAIEEMTGFSAETMLGKGDYEYGVALYQERCPILVDLPFSWDDDIAKRYSFINKDNGTFYAERDVPHMRGRKRTLWCKASPLRDESGDIIGAIESIRDVTDRKQAEEALREAKDYTENLINSANVLIVGLDTVGRITLLNEAGEKMTGYRADEVIGKSWVELFISRATGLRVADEFDRLKNAGSAGSIINTFENPIKTKSGEERIISWRNSALRHGGKFVGIISFGMDITDRKQAEAALRRSEERYRSIFENSPLGIFQSTLEGGFTRMNPAFARILGYGSPRDAIGSAADIAARMCADLQENAKTLQRTGKKGARIICEHEYLRKDGRKWVGHLTLSMIRDENGVPHHLDGIVEDVTEKKIMEETLQRTMEQLRTLSHRLLEIQETERRYIARELHDEIGQALTALRIDLKRTERSDSLESALTLVRESTPTVTELINKVRNLSIELRPSILDDFGLTAALDWYVNWLSARVGFRVVFHADFTEERFSPILELTCFRITQEALTNVARHSHAKMVYVDLEKLSEELHLTVRDDGKGFNIDDTHMKALKGESFGLLGMKERASLAGGHLELVSQPGKGTVIHAHFPLGSKEPSG